MQNRYNRRNRRKYNLKVHVVLETKYRKALLQDGIDDFVKRAISYLADQNDWTIIAMETDKDHLHILLEYDATDLTAHLRYYAFRPGHRSEDSLLSLRSFLHPGDCRLLYSCTAVSFRINYFISLVILHAFFTSSFGRKEISKTIPSPSANLSRFLINYLCVCSLTHYP